MKQNVLFLAIDVDDKSFHAAAVTESGELYKAFTSKPDSGCLIQKIEQYCGTQFKVRICYEATHIGFSLCRELRGRGLQCEVIAPSLIPSIAGPKVKTDRLDAKLMASYYSKGILTPIHVPDFDDEMDRSMVRMRDFIREQYTDTKRKILSTCRTLGWNYRLEANNSSASHWTQIHRRWLEAKIKEAPERVRRNLDLVLLHLDQLQTRMEMFEDRILELSKEEKYKKRVEALTCYRGLDTLSAMVLIVEIGDVRRFAHPRGLVSFAGLDIAEYSSGGKERKTRITKMGNRHLRRILVEANQRSHIRPQIGRRLKDRRLEADPALVAVADRCMERLHKKAARMFVRGKCVNKIKTACGREMLGFVWESLRKTAA